MNRSQVPRSTTPASLAPGESSSVLRHRAEQEFAHELEELARVDDRPKPPNWRLSPLAARTYLLGGKLENGFEVSPKYIGNARLIEIAIATLATDRALLLFGLPGTAKSWVSEHLAAAISGDSALLIQGTAGLDETALRYGWNYARLLAEGPSLDALVPSPMMRAMQTGKLARVEEFTRISSEVQDTLITILSEKTLPIPELDTTVQAQKGFNIIATANNRDKGVNELSSALMRRFNTVVLPVPETLEAEIEIVERRVDQLGRALELPAEKPALQEIRRIVTVFRELREGITLDGKTKLKSPSGTLSTAEAISVANNGMAMAAYYGDGVVRAGDFAAGITGSIIKDPVHDRVVWLEYLQTVVKERDGWKDLYRACREVL
jgi:MoxR-like ATPase